jgi:hypothetical protein
MSRIALVSAFIVAVSLTLSAQNTPPKPKSLDFESLGKLVVGTGYKTETGQGVYKVTLPGEDGWFVEVWLSKSAPVVLITFPCQALPSGKVEQPALLALLSQNGRMDGAYFGYNEKTRNFYLESTLGANTLTPLVLKMELERLQKLAVKTADQWDTGKWTVVENNKK